LNVLISLHPTDPINSVKMSATRTLILSIEVPPYLGLSAWRVPALGKNRRGHRKGAPGTSSSPAPTCSPRPNWGGHSRRWKITPRLADPAQALEPVARRLVQVPESVLHARPAASDQFLASRPSPSRERRGATGGLLLEARHLTEDYA
jgi:hypothetical protein